MVRGYAVPESNVLDVGCGRGGVVELVWRDVKLAAGLDPDSRSLTGHRARGMPILRGVGEHLPFASGSFDLVVSVWVLEHLREPLTVFREVGRVPRPGAPSLFLTPHLHHPPLPCHPTPKPLP